MTIMAQIEESVRYFFDKKYAKAVYRYIFHRELNWKNPTRYTEKIHIFKISRAAEALSSYVDKYAVREYVAKTIGEKYLIPLYGVYTRAQDIELSELPREFVLKTTHGSNWNILCPDKDALNWQEAKEKLTGWLATNYYDLCRERQYKNIQPRIVCEKLLHEGPEGLTDYKFHCFGGKAYCIRAQAARITKIRKSFYDLDWNMLPLNFTHGADTPPPALIDRPKNLKKMIELAEELAVPFEYVRVDLYNIDGEMYFGELTFTPNNGQDHFEPDFYDEVFGEMIEYRGNWRN